MCLLASVGFSTITLQLAHQDGTRPEASLVQESRTAKAQGPFNANSAAASGMMFWGIGRAFPGEGGRESGTLAHPRANTDSLPSLGGRQLNNRLVLALPPTQPHALRPYLPPHRAW